MAGLTESGFIGHHGAYDDRKEEFTSYYERMGLFILANGFTIEEDEKQRADMAETRKAIFLNEAGATIYSMLSNLIAPAKPKGTSFAKIISTLKQQYDSASLEIAESYKFAH